MRAQAVVALGLLAAACGRRATAASREGGAAAASTLAGSAGPRAGEAPIACTTDAKFPVMLGVPEASAAAEVELTPGVREILVVSDSGRNGAALLWQVPAGPTRAITLPLDRAASDDIEGIAWVAPAGSPPARGALYTLTSSGAVRRFVPDGKGGLVRDQDAYALGPAPHACPNLHDANCGRNYEGLCLRPRSTPARCAGYAASKQASELDCLVFQGDRLVADDLWPPVKLGRGLIAAGALSDCAFGAESGPARATLLVAANVYGGSTTYILTESTGALAPLDAAGTLNNEAVAVDRDGSLYLFGDIDADLSPSLRYTCAGW